MDFFMRSDAKGSIGDRFRAKRFAFFEKCLAQIEGTARILDLGGTVYFWENRGWLNNPKVDITLLNLEAEDTGATNIQSVAGSAIDLSSYQDNAFDIVFSNSVIEHLYTWDNQVKMAKESRRVGQYHFVQTPNKYFFIEPHYRLPFFDAVPDKIAYQILTKTPIAHGKRWEPEMAKTWLAELRLLSKKEVRTLFPDSLLYVETFLGMTKSFTAHNFEGLS